MIAEELYEKLESFSADQMLAPAIMLVAGKEVPIVSVFFYDDGLSPVIVLSDSELLLTKSKTRKVKSRKQTRRTSWTQEEHDSEHKTVSQKRKRCKFCQSEYVHIKQREPELSLPFEPELYQETEETDG